MNNEQIFRIDGVKWWIPKTINGAPRHPVPLCPDHNLRLRSVVVFSDGRVREEISYSEARIATDLKCEKGHCLKIPRPLEKEKTYVIDVIDAKTFEKMKVMDIDGELTPVAKEKIKDDEYFLTAQIMESKRGKQVVIYAGEKKLSASGKSQIIIDKENRRVSFDQKDLNPADVFAEVKVTFRDGSSHTIKGKK